MNILQFIETGGPGGAEKAVLKISKELISRGHSIQIGTTREGWLTEQIGREKISRTLFLSNSGFDLKLVFKIVRYVKKNKIDLIHSHLLDSNVYCSVASKICGIPCIATEHGDIHHLEKKRFAGLKIKLISTFAKKIIAVSNFSKQALINAGMKKDKILVLGNPIDLLNHQSKYKTRAEIHPSLTDSEWIWVHVGNLRPVKDQSTLIRGFALSQVLSNQEHKLIIIGDGKLKEELVTLSKSLKISDNIIFLGHRDDVIDILPHCNGFIISSISEALPISLLEAIRERLVVVASKVGGIPEVVRENETGYLFSAKNAEELSKKISYVLNNQEEAKNIASNAYIFLENNFETNKIIEDLIKSYND